METTEHRTLGHQRPEEIAAKDAPRGASLQLHDRIAESRSE